MNHLPAWNAKPYFLWKNTQKSKCHLLQLWLALSDWLSTFTLTYFMYSLFMSVFQARTTKKIFSCNTKHPCANICTIYKWDFIQSRQLLKSGSYLASVDCESWHSHWCLHMVTMETILSFSVLLKLILQMGIKIMCSCELNNISINPCHAE